MSKEFRMTVIQIAGRFFLTCWSISDANLKNSIIFTAEI